MDVVQGAANHANAVSTMGAAREANGLQNTFGYAGAGYVNNDEIDIVELLGFFFKIRKSLGMGLLAGAVAGVAFSFAMPTAVYRTRVSVSVDTASLPAIVEPKKVVEAFTGALASPDSANAALKRLWEGAPQLQGAFAKRGIRYEELLASQTLPGSASKSAPLKIESSSSTMDFVLEVNLRERGLRASENSGIEASKLVLSAFNDAANDFNARILSMSQESSKNQVRQATKAVQEAESSNGDVQVQREEEITRIRNELSRLEFRLSKRASAEKLNFLLGYFSELKPYAPAAQILTPLANGQLQGLPSDSGQLGIERVVRLLSGLEEEGRLSKKEAEEIRDKIVELQLAYVKNEHLYSSVISSNKAVLNLLYESMAKAVVPVDRSLTFLPLFRLNERLYSSSEANKTLEVLTQQKRILFVVGGAFLGILLGALFGGGRIFFAKNRAKFRSITSEGSV